MKSHLNALILLSLVLFFGCTKEELDPALFSPGLSNFTIENKKIGQSPFLLTKPTSDSDGAIIFATKDTALVKISGDTVTLKAAGKCTIYALQRGTEKYRADTISASFMILDSLSANLSGFPAIAKRLGELPFTLTDPKSDNSSPFNYRTSDTAIVSISGKTVTLKREGKCIITAEQGAKGDYKKASISAELTVAPKLSAIITSIVFPVKKVGEPDFTFDHPKSNSTGAFFYTSSNVNVAYVYGNQLSIRGPGKTTITIAQLEAGIYKTTIITADFTVIENPALSTLQDVDGNTYKAVKIGKQIWMAENLKTKHYTDGSPIPYLRSNADWANLGTGGGYAMYDHDEKTGRTFGYLYNRAAVTDSRQLAPAGWHIPSKEEWEVLYQYIGGTRESGLLLRDQYSWSPQMENVNSTLFSAMGAGYRLSNGEFTGYITDTAWWSTGTVPYYSLYTKGYFEAGPLSSLNITGCSVRCIKD
ncbi:MAG TPA: fibrobacter succinogenes major paralogous domain-containing protein [Pedobacter sp.]|uniref:fibrobacter succinogenes major paralogous domain-containing protein n=1 Tax=Pedobacter sp. TaxID=1411316 RepID=UPI002C1B3F4A|nr:fibrobacter succinogenes major paralogous domain-containing protein [Pedobacter sp.]HMI02594.1 fibrobacter succinogenes major paralogous domain-containing protein [Pedobacter sp.]